MSRNALSEFQWVAGGPDRTSPEESGPLGRWWQRHGGPVTLMCWDPLLFRMQRVIKTVRGPPPVPVESGIGGSEADPKSYWGDGGNHSRSSRSYRS